jgi:hypothetical protein
VGQTSSFCLTIWFYICQLLSGYLLMHVVWYNCFLIYLSVKYLLVRPIIIKSCGQSFSYIWSILCS